MKPSGGLSVMQNRRDQNDFLEDFPTPPWATRALCFHVLDSVGLGPRDTIWEPACNRGYMARPLAEYCGRVRATDIHDYGWEGQEETRDFLFPGEGLGCDWIITNPPFRLGSQFARRCLDLKPHKGFAMIVRTAFLEGQERYRELFSINPPAIVAQFTERVPMVKGRHDPTASTATSYAWLVWLTGTRSTEFRWIPPCRKQLERPDDAPCT